MELFTWVPIDFEDIQENDLIRSITIPVSQQHLGHFQADRTIQGRVITKGNTLESTIIDFDGDIVPLAYDGLGDDVIMTFLKGTTNIRGLWDRESGKRRKLHFGNDISYLKKII